MGRKTVLMIDDNLDHLEAYRDVLCEEYDVAITQSPDEAINLGIKNNYDVILIDIHMPLKDGFEVFNAIKQHNTKSSFIFITGYSDLNFVDAHNAGIDDIIKKPIGPAALKMLLKNRIQQKKNKNGNNSD